MKSEMLNELMLDSLDDLLRKLLQLDDRDLFTAVIASNNLHRRSMLRSLVNRLEGEGIK